jgi:hypothetical protein
MHPYDAMDHHNLENGGEPFRWRFKHLVGEIGSISGQISECVG